MTFEEVERLRVLAGEVRWDFPSSSGSPVLDLDAAWIVRLLVERESFVAAARFLRNARNSSTATIPTVRP